MLEKPHIRSRAALVKEQDIGINASVGAEYTLGQPDDRLEVEIFQQFALELGFRPLPKQETIGIQIEFTATLMCECT